MKTNAQPKTIVKAVENVSAAKYDQNVIFRKYPEKVTKNVVRFTLRTLDATKIGSLKTKAGQLQPKANWDVHQDVMNEIFRLDPRPNIYVDTIYGRQHNPSPVAITAETEAAMASVDKTTGKRKYTKRNGSKRSKSTPPNLNKVLEAIKYIVAHPESVE